MDSRLKEENQLAEEVQEVLEKLTTVLQRAEELGVNILLEARHTNEEKNKNKAIIHCGDKNLTEFRVHDFTKTFKWDHFDNIPRG